MTSKSLPPVAKGFPTVEGMNQLMINLSADGAAGAAEVAARIEPGRQKLATHLAQHSAKPVEGMGNLSVNLSADGALKVAASIEADNHDAGAGGECPKDGGRVSTDKAITLKES
jgi:hypothetical protein